MRAQSGKRSNDLPYRKVFHTFTALCQQSLHSLRRRADPFFIFNVFRSGPCQKVAVDSRGHEHALSVCARKLENSMGNITSRLFIHQAVFSLSCHDLHILRTYHIVDRIRINTCSIHYRLRPKAALARFDPISFFRFYNLFHLCIQEKFRPIFRGVFRQRHRQMKRADDSSRRRIKSGLYFVGNMRLHFFQFFFIQDPDTLYPVFFSLLF